MADQEKVSQSPVGDMKAEDKTNDAKEDQIGKNLSAGSAEYYEMYYDANNKWPYFYNPKTGASVWELPKGAICADMTGGNMEQINQDVVQEQVQEELSEAKKKLIEIEELKRKNLEAMYPEYYNNADLVNQESDQEEEEPEHQIQEFDKFKRVLNKDLMKRPARRQVQDMRKDTAYIEGNYDYNIWYDKYLTDSRQEQEKVASMYKCEPQEDTGYTKADKYDKATYFCTYFARGWCSEGVNCRYYHRVPQPEDLRDDEIIKDCFGRTRHSKFKDDFTGIGSFSQDCTTLKVWDIVIPDRSRSIRDLLRIFYEAFAPWGDLVDIHLNVAKWIGFVKYSHRYYAEFAREAMLNQVIFGGNDPITIKWAINNPFEKKEQEREDQINSEIENLKKHQQMIQDHVKRTLKEVDKKVGGKRKRDDDFEERLMDDSKRGKYQEDDDDEPDNKQIADNLSKLSNVLQRIEANKDADN